jgi:hypothetical protein
MLTNGQAHPGVIAITSRKPTGGPLKAGFGLSGEFDSWTEYSCPSFVFSRRAIPTRSSAPLTAG